MSLGGCLTGADVNPNELLDGVTFGLVKYGRFKRLIASIRNWIFIPSRIRKFFEIPTSNLRNRWYRRTSTESGKFRKVTAELDA
jgi:hypothetical protein